MKKKIIYIFDLKYNFYYHQRYGLEYIKKFFDLDIIDMSEYYNPNLKYDYKDVQSEINIHKIKNLNELRNLLKKINADFAFLLLTKESNANEIFNICKNEFSLKIIDFFLNCIPTLISYRTYKIKISMVFSKHLFTSFLEIFKKFLKKILYFFNIFKGRKNQNSIDMFFIAGNDTKLLEKNKFSKKIINTHSFDYELYLNRKNNKKIFSFKKNTAVFLDEQMFDHIDNQIMGSKPPVSENYFSELNNFFNFIEKKINIEVIIALHPRCENEDYKKLFMGRECFIHKTLDLVKESSIVLLHASTTGISFPVICKKPLIFITTNELEKSLPYKIRFETYKSILQQPSINISLPECYNNFNSYNYINTKGYDDYFRSYIKSDDSEDKPLWETFVTHLKACN